MVLSGPRLGTSPRWKKWLLIVVLCLLTSGAIIGLALGLTLGRHHPDQPKQEVAPDEPPESAYPDPEPMNGTVPNNADWRTMDPSLIRRASDGKLFLFTTGSRGEPNGTVWTSDSLYGPWTKSATAMINQQAGAPQVYRLQDTYYMFHNHHFQYKTIGVGNAQADKWWHDSSVYVRSSKTMEHGTWTFHGRLNITWAPKYNILDPSYLGVQGNYTTAAGTNTTRHFLSFGSYQTGLFQVPLADPPTRLADNAMLDLVHLEQNTTSISTGIKDRTEASFQYYREGWYYLFFSSGICCHSHGRWEEAINDPYHVMVCRSEDPRSGFVDKDGRDCLTDNGGTQILATHGSIFVPGGQGVLDDGEVGGTILYYHYVPRDNITGVIEMGYRFGWNRLDFGSDGWPTVV